MKTYNEIVALIEAAKEDVEKFFVKGNKSAGTRVRKHMQDLKALAQQLRTEVQEAKNAETEAA
jgi:hypothetical protein